MASSPVSERYARSLREAGDNLNITRNSLPSDAAYDDLTESHLSVDEESSQAFNSQPLPHRGEDTKRSSRSATRQSQDFEINTSAIGRAFPDMTGSGSSIDEGSSVDIEFGRGGTRNLSDDGSSKENWTLNGKYKVDLSKLPKRDFSSGQRLKDVSTNITHPHISSAATKATQYGTSGSSRQSSVEYRQQVPPKVTVEDAEDHTGSSQSQNSTLLNARFAGRKARDSLAIPKRFSGAKDLLRNLDEPKGRANTASKLGKSINENPTATSTNGGTVQSFMLPNMPEMSELVSGIYDGTPLNSRHHGGRFASRQKSPAVKHAAVSSLPAPYEEERIIRSLQVLRDKVSELERNKAESQVAIQDLMETNRELEHERNEWKRVSRRQASGMSSNGSDAGDEGRTDMQKAINERIKLQTTVRNLQNELEGANRRAAIAEANVKNVSQERDEAVSQLGIAFLTQEELKAEGKALKQEIKRLELEVKKYRSAIESYLEREEDDLPEKSERTEKTAYDKTRAEDEDDSSQGTGSADCKVLNVEPQRPSTRRQMSRSGTVDKEEPVIQIPKRRKRRIILEEYTATTDFDGFEDLSGHQERTGRNTTQPSRNMSRNMDTQTRPISRAPSTKQVREEIAKDPTLASHVSFLQDGDVTMLRKMLEREHLVKKGRLQKTDNDPTMPISGDDDEKDITQLSHRTSRSRALPRKSSMKDLTGKLTNIDREAESDDEVQTTRHSRPASQVRRRHSDASMPGSKANLTRVPAVDDMTSAFILPDITMNLRQRRTSQATADVTKPTSVAVPEIVVNGAPHESDNCTICTRIIGNCSHDDGKQPEVTIPQPVKASERIHDLALDEADHTKRPSEPPSQALAKVIKGLEDEYQHLVMQVNELQDVYGKMDPSLQKRKRKALKERIDKLRNTLDAKADQIYSLYDVLEGQKKSGRLDDMTQQELNETLTNVLGDDGDLANLGMPAGIMFKRGQKTSAADVTPAKERAKPRKMSMNEEETKNSRPTSAAGSRKFPWDESYEDDDAESLPWEGFDDTIDLTKGSRRSNTSSRRRSVGL